MATYSTSLKLTLIGTGDEAGTWGTTTNTNLGDLLDQAIAGSQSIAMSDANLTLSSLNGSLDQARNLGLILTGALTATRNVIIPNVPKTYFVWNTTSGSQTIRIQTVTPTAYVDINNGYMCMVYCDGAGSVNRITSNVNPSNMNATFGAIVNTGEGVSTGDSVIELGGLRTGSGNTYIDFHATPSTDYETRLLRQSGIDGAFTIQNTGTGSLVIQQTNSGIVDFYLSGSSKFTIGSGGQVAFSNSYGTNGQVLTSSGSGSAPAWLTPTGVTSVAQSFTGGLISVGGSPVTTTGTLALTVAGTSGGVPYFNSSSTWASSGVLTSGSLMVGGGAGGTPVTITTGAGVVTGLSNAVNASGGMVTVDGTATLTNKTLTSPTLTGSVVISGNIFSTATNAAWNIAGGNTYNNGGGVAVYGSTGAIPGAVVFNAGTGATNAEIARVTSVGLGITVDPSYKLHVKSAVDATTNPIALVAGASFGVRIGSSSGNSFIQGVDSGGASTYEALNIGARIISFTTGSTTSITPTMTLASDNNVYVGPTATQAGATSIVYAKNTAKAWVNFTGATPPVINSSHNVSSVTRTSTGKFVVNFTTAMASANYSVSLSSSKASTDDGSVNMSYGGTSNYPSTTACPVTCVNNGGLADPQTASVVVFV